MFCPKCQHWNKDGANFCQECGADLRKAAPASAAMKPAVKTVQVPPVLGSVPTGASISTQSPKETDVSRPPYTGPRLELAATGSIFKVGDRVVIGREDSSLDIDLDGYPEAKYISHHHAQLTRVNDRTYIEDLGSSNGTYVNNRKLASGQIEPLTSGDVIRFGKLEMTYQDS